MATTTSPRRSQSVRLFGYDIFISFALGPPPRGSRSYASDLARKLRERDFTVFFSEDEAPVGAELDQTLKKALWRSRVLVVIANAATLADPRWVRAEVEEFRRRHPTRPVVPISIAGSLQDAGLADAVATWLPFRDRIWIDESQEAADAGMAGDEVVARLATAPNAVRSAVRWRALVGSVLVFFAGLAVLSTVMGVRADRAAKAEALAADEARQAERRASEAATREAEAADEARAAEARAVDAAGREAQAASAAVAARNEAVRQRDIAVARQLGAQAELMRTQQPERLPLAMLMAIQSLRLQPQVVETQQTLRRLAAASPIQLAVRPHGGAVTQVAIQPRGSKFASAGAGGGHLWNWSATRPLADLPGASEQVVFSSDGGVVAGCCREVGAWTSDGARLVALDAAALQGRAERIALSPDGQWLAVGLTARHPALFVVDTRSGRTVLRQELTLSGQASALAFGPDGRLYFAPRETIEVREGPDLKVVGRLSPGIGGVSLLALDPGGRHLAASGDQRVAVFDLARPEPSPRRLETAGDGPGRVVDLRFDGAGRYLSAVGDQNTGSVWRTAGFDPVLRVSHREFQTIGTLAFDPAEPRVVSCADDGNCFVWSLPGGERLQRFWHLPLHAGPAAQRTVTGTAMMQTAGGWRLVSGGMDGTLRLWDLTAPGPSDRRVCARDGYHIGTFAMPGTSWQWVTGRFVPNNRGCRPAPTPVPGALEEMVHGNVEIATLPVDRVRLADRSSGRVMSELVHDDPVDWEAVQQRLIAGGMTSYRAYLPEIERLKTRGSVQVPAVSASGAHLITFRKADLRLRFWDTATAQVVLDEPAAAGPPRWMHFVDERRWLQLARDGRLSMRRLPDGATLWAVDAGEPTALALDPGTGRLAWATERPQARMQVIQVADGRTLMSKALPVPAGELLWAAAGRHLVALSGRAEVPEGLPLGVGVTLWDVDRDRARLTLASSAQVAAFAFTKDGRRLATLGRGGDLRLWDASSGRPLGSTVVAEVGPVAFSTGGRWLALGRRTLTVLESNSLQPVAQFDIEGEARQIGFTEDDRGIQVKRFLRDEDAGTFGTFGWQADALLAEACRRLPAGAWAQWKQLMPDQPPPAPCPP